MSEAPAADVPAGYGILTDAGIERLRQRIGIPTKRPNPPHNFVVNWDGTRHFAFGYGDDNPLWCDEAYGKGTRWGALIAPPNFHYTMGETDGGPTEEQKKTLKGDPLIGLGSYQAVMEFEWYRPLYEGDRLGVRGGLIGVKVNDNSKFSGRTVSEVQGYINRNQKGEITALRRGTWIRAERHASAAKKKEYELPKPYSKEQLAEIDAAYEAETIRGAEPLYFEDVHEGDAIPTIVRGPMRTSDLVVWHVGWGMQLTPPGAFKVSYKTRRKVPGMYTPNELNVPDTVQRLHWEKAWANQLGIPISYDYGAMRETFLTNILTNWMGDNAWLWKLSCQHRKFVYTGDTYWMKGRVVAKKQVEGRNEVHLDVWVENQWGTVVTPGNAVVLLPSRGGQHVDLPKPDHEDMDALWARQVELQAQQA